MENKQALNFINLYNSKGERHGSWEYYYDDGQLLSKGNYVAGKQHGSWEYYYDDGQLLSKGNYVAGKEHGSWEVYYDNGKLRSKGFYDQGNKVDYNPLESKQMELSLDEIASKFGVNVNQLKIKK